MSQFTIEENKNLVHVTIKGLGVVTINRTFEGLIIDVHNFKEPDSLDSIALMENDFEGDE